MPRGQTGFWAIILVYWHGSIILFFDLLACLNLQAKISACSTENGSVPKILTNNTINLLFKLQSAFQ